SVSIAARDSFRVATDSWVNSQARSGAVRSVHLPPMRTRLTPRGAYSRCNCWSNACTSMPAGSRDARTFSSSGAAAANSKASRMRSPSARSGSFLSPTITRISATFPIGFFSLLAIPRLSGSALRQGGVGVPFLAQIERRESALLVRFELALPDHFERRGKARSQHGGGRRRIGEIGKQILIEWAPVHVLADQPLQRFTRFGEGPHRALRTAPDRPRLALPP